MTGAKFKLTVLGNVAEESALTLPRWGLQQKIRSFILIIELVMPGRRTR
jgi:hypothetical protein